PVGRALFRQRLDGARRDQCHSPTEGDRSARALGSVLRAAACGMWYGFFLTSGTGARHLGLSEVSVSRTKGLRTDAVPELLGRWCATTMRARHATGCCEFMVLCGSHT